MQILGSLHASQSLLADCSETKYKGDTSMPDDPHIANRTFHLRQTGIFFKPKCTQSIQVVSLSPAVYSRDVLHSQYQITKFYKCFKHK